MPLTAPTTIASGFNDAVGCAYQISTDRLFIADASAVGTISAVTAHTHVKTVVGTGYGSLTDIALSADDAHVFVLERPGSLLRVSLSNANRAAATVVTSGLNGINQIALDEAHGFAYTVESSAGQLTKIDLATGAKTVVGTGLWNARGVLLTSDGRFAYVSGDSGDITRFDFATGTRTVVASGLAGPRFLTWADAGESTILFPVPNPTGTVLMLDLTANPAVVTPIAGPMPYAPFNVAVVSPDKLLVTSQQEISQVDLTGSVFSAAGPVVLGIGFVPADAAHLPNGYADTTMDPTYFYQVKDCPFGGTLPLMLNWDKMRTLNAHSYKISIQGAGGPVHQVTQPFGDYRWSVPLNRFELVTTVPTNGFYPVRVAGQIWLNYWLGLLLDTSGQPNGLNTITVSLFGAQNAPIPNSTSTVVVMIDNTVPTAIIEQIQHDGHSVDTCAIVNTGTTMFAFQITASAPKHLQGWRLDAWWGDNASKPVASDDYSHHISASRLWTGLTSAVVPAPLWDATVKNDTTSTHCAHTFVLSASDRVINGWGYIHGAAGYHKSITIML